MFAVENEHNVTKTVNVGFSWTTLFFGGWVPILRGDWKWALIYCIGTPVILTTISSHLFLIALLAIWLGFPAIYNKLYARGLWNSGFRGKSAESNRAFKEYAA